MKFGAVPTKKALGATLAHSLNVGDVKLRKGRELTVNDIEGLLAENVLQVTVSRLDPDDISENAAADALATELATPDIRADAPFTGRANLVAQTAGVLRVDTAVVNAINNIDEAITLATLPDYARAAKGQMVATVKIIPYGVPSEKIAKAKGQIARNTLALHPFKLKSATLILTETPGFKPSLIDKARKVIETRLRALSINDVLTKIVPHETNAVASEIRAAKTDLTLILGASATSDRADVCPAALVDAGGELTRFGMPVDPGNLLFFGDFNGKPVIGLPGCARSPALNGADWVLERMAAGLNVTHADIAAMGTGGLLKEIPTRPQPRLKATRQVREPVVDILLLAAGSSSRMKGRDKLMELVDGEPLLTRTARAAVNSNAHQMHVILPSDTHPRCAALKDLNVATAISHDAAEGMAASLRAGLQEVSSEVDAVIVAFADMPDIQAADYNAIISGFAPDEGASIVRATTSEGRPGHPVLFSRHFFEPLSGLRGDEGARAILRSAPELVRDVALNGDAAITDLDTPQAWDAWRAKR